MKLWNCIDVIDVIQAARLRQLHMAVKTILLDQTMGRIITWCDNNNTPEDLRNLGWVEFKNTFFYFSRTLQTCFIWQKLFFWSLHAKLLFTQICLKQILKFVRKWKVEPLKWCTYIFYSNLCYEFWWGKLEKILFFFLYISKFDHFLLEYWMIFLKCILLWRGWHFVW